MPFQIQDTAKYYTKEVSKEIRLSWYIFAYKFLSCVNSDWLKSITGRKAQLKINLFKFISVSDEAFTRWVLEVKYKKVMTDMKSNNSVTKKKPEKSRGSHDSLKFSRRYTEIYQEVKTGRSAETRTIYNNWFWTYFMKHNPLLFADAAPDKRTASGDALKEDMPDEDEEIHTDSINITETYTENDIDDYLEKIEAIGV